MLLEYGLALAEFINNNNARYVAATFDFSSGCWVLIADLARKNRVDHTSYIEPIEHVERYLSRANHFPERFPPDLLRLLEQWLTICPAT